MPKVKEKILPNSFGGHNSNLIPVSILTLLFCLIFPPPVNSLYAADNNKIALENQSSSPLPGGLNDAEAKRLVSDWLRLSEDDEKLEALMALYADTVSYYKQKNAVQSFIRADKMKYYKRWPERKYTVKSVEMLADTDYYTKTMVVSYHFELKNKEKTLEGDAESFLWLKKKTDGIFIIFETGHVIAKNGNEVVSEKDKTSNVEKKIALPKRPRKIVIDSKTGYTVFPEELEISDPATHRIFYQRTFSKEESIKEFKDGLISTSFLALVPIPPGLYECTVKTSNYKPRTSSCRVGNITEQEKNKKYSSLQQGRTEFHIDPIEPPPELRNESLTLLKQKDSSVLVGFISDDDSGLLLADVCVGTADGNISTKSNGRGFFVIRLPLKDYFKDTMTDIVSDIVFEKEGYQIEERDYYPLDPYAVGMTRVRLVPGKGRKIIDERKHRRWGQVPDREIIRKPCR